MSWDGGASSGEEGFPSQCALSTWLDSERQRMHGSLWGWVWGRRAQREKEGSSLRGFRGGFLEEVSQAEQLVQRPGSMKKVEEVQIVVSVCSGGGGRGGCEGQQEAGLYLEDDEEPQKDSEQGTARVQGVF